MTRKTNRGCHDRKGTKVVMTSLDSIFYKEQGTVVVMIKKCRHDYDSQVFRIERRVRIQPGPRKR